LRKTNLGLCFAAALAAALPGARAAPAGSSGSRASPRTSPHGAARQPTSARRNVSGQNPRQNGESSGKGGFRPLSSQVVGTPRAYPRPPRGRQSVLDGTRPPSSTITRLIREKENSGPGWVGTAVLVWLLSQHNLSHDDRAWINGRLADLEPDGTSVTPALLPSAVPKIQFRYDGLAPVYYVGSTITVTVSAFDGEVAVPVKCDLPGAAITNNSNESRITGTADLPGIQILTCAASGSNDRRLIQTSNSGPTPGNQRF
jgi:hypothetical protein